MTTATIENAGRTVNHTNYPRRLRALSIGELRGIINDCRDALAALPDSPNAGRYADEICYAAAEIKRRGN